MWNFILCGPLQQKKPLERRLFCWFSDTLLSITAVGAHLLNFNSNTQRFEWKLGVAPVEYANVRKGIVCPKLITHVSDLRLTYLYLFTIFLQVNYYSAVTTWICRLNKIFERVDVYLTPIVNPIVSHQY